MDTQTIQLPWIRGLSSNSTAGSFASLAETTTPTPITNVRRGFLLIQPFGVGANNATYDMRVLGWRKANVGSNYIATVIGQWACILSADTGTASGYVLDTERYADTISQTFGPSPTIIVSPTGDVRGWLMVDLSGALFYTLDFALGTATEANALVSEL